MAYIKFAVNLTNNGYAELERDTIKYWPTEGLPVYEGPIEGLEIEYPAILSELIDSNIIRTV